MTGVAKISRVLVGMDFDETSAAALKIAASLASAWHAELTVIHATTESVPAYFTASQIEELEVEREQSRRAIADQLRAFAEQHVSGPVNLVIKDSPPQDAIARLAPAFDLIVVGTHRRHGPQRWWLGSVAEAVVRQSPRPVLVVPADASLLDTRRAPIILAASEDGRAADAWVNLLRTTFGGTVVRSLDIHQCAPDRLQRADLIVFSLFTDARHSQLNAIAHVLKECLHPVLFVPESEGIVERSSS